MRKIWISVMFAILAAIGLSAAAQPASAAPTVGIWYSTWYAKKPAVATTWSTGFGTGSTNQLLGDVSGDGKDDAVTFTSGTGVWNIGVSNGNGFNMATSWRTGHGTGTNNQFLADVNNDGKKDAVAYNGTTGNWTVAISSGTAFNAPSSWISGHGVGSNNQFMADVNGDGRSDSVVFFNGAGSWYVALSTGTAFSGYTQWAVGHGTGSTSQFMSDTNGDGKADSIIYISNTGTWFVAPSSGTAFTAYYQWTTGHGTGSLTQLVTDGNGDGFAEPAVFFNFDQNADSKSGDWYTTVYEKMGNKLSGFQVMNSGFGYNATKLFQGNVTGDPYGWKASVSYTASTGTWKVDPYHYFKQNLYNTWTAWNIKYNPLTLGSYQTYDSNDTAVIDEHLATLAAASVDFLLFDATNYIYVDDEYIYQRGKTVSSRIKTWNSNPSNRNLKYALAVGALQATHNPASVEFEAGVVWDKFVNTVDGGTTNFHYVNGKPLLVLYSSTADRNAWISWGGSKANSNKFTVRFAEGGSPSGFYGWFTPPTGTIVNNDVMVVMSGWNNHVVGFTPISRAQGDYYSLLGWDRVMQKNPKPAVVVINSFNEYAEETAVAVADTTNVTGSTEKWLNKSGVMDNFMYWNMTKAYIKRLGNLAFSAAVTSSSSGESGDWGKSRINDGQLNSVGGSMGYTSESSLTTNHTEHIQLDMGSSKTVSKVDLYPRNESGQVGKGFPVNFTIQISTDNINWTTVVTRTAYAQPGNSVQSFTFTAASARYVKVVGTSLRLNGTEYRMQFAEMEVY